MTVSITFDKSDFPNLYNLNEALSRFTSGPRKNKQEEYPVEIHNYYTMEQLRQAEKSLQGITKEKIEILLVGDGKEIGEKTPEFDELLSRKPELNLVYEMLGFMI